MGTNMSFLAQLIIKDLVVEGHYGTTEKERSKPQSLKLDAWATVDIENAGRSDLIGETVDWSVFREILIETTTNNSFNLIERLATVITDKILEDIRIIKIRLRVTKLNAFTNGTPVLELIRTNA
jgi:dihydroneopterin aldolase